LIPNSAEEGEGSFGILDGFLAAALPQGAVRNTKTVIASVFQEFEPQRILLALGWYLRSALS
jgi:hypothetical protein